MCIRDRSRDAPPRAAQPATGSTVSPARPQISSAAQQGTPSPARATPPAWHKPSAQAGVQAASVMPAAPPQTHVQPSAEMQPNITPADRRPAVAPARRERKTEYRDAGSRPGVSPRVRTPDMAAPPPTGQPRTLRRSAQPLNSKVTPDELPRGCLLYTSINNDSGQIAAVIPCHALTSHKSLSGNSIACLLYTSRCV